MGSNLPLIGAGAALELPCDGSVSGHGCPFLWEKPGVVPVWRRSFGGCDLRSFEEGDGPVQIGRVFDALAGGNLLRQFSAG